MSVLKTLAQKLAGVVLGEYSPYFIYRCRDGQTSDGIPVDTSLDVHPVDTTAFADADPLFNYQADYLGSESRAFGCFLDGDLAGVCFYWFGERYKRRGFWPLAPAEAKLVQILVSPRARGRGVAPALIRASARAMAAAGFTTLYARIWHSNIPSLRAFEKAGWSRIAFVLECNPFRSDRPLRFQRKLGAK